MLGRLRLPNGVYSPLNPVGKFYAFKILRMLNSHQHFVKQQSSDTRIIHINRFKNLLIGFINYSLCDAGMNYYRFLFGGSLGFGGIFRF